MELYIFSPDGELLTILTESNGLTSTHFRDQINSVASDPFTFTVDANVEYEFADEENERNLTQVAGSFIGTMEDFTVPEKINVSPAQFVKDENRVIFRDKEGDFREFVIKELDDIDNIDGPQTTAICLPAWLDELSEHYVLDKRYSDKEAQLALNDALEGTRYTGKVEVSLGLASANFYRLSSVDCIWEILKVWGGEIKDVIEIAGNKVTARKIIIKQRLVADKGARFEIDHNIEEIQRTVLSYPKTAMYGWGASLETDGGGHTRYIDFGDVEWKVSNGHPVDKPKGQKWVGDPNALLKYGREHEGELLHRFAEFSNQDYEDPEELLWATWLNLQDNKEPVVNYKLSVDMLDKDASLGDGAVAIDREFARPIEIQTRVIAIEYDLLDIEGTAVVEMGQFLDLGEDDVYRDIDELKERVNKPPKPIDNESFPDVKPSTPVNVEAHGAFQTIQLFWDYDDAVYIAHYEVYGSKVAGFVPDSQHLLYRGRVSAFSHEVNTDEVWYYYVRAVNTRGTASDFSVLVSASSVRIMTPDILFGSILADHLQDNLNLANKLSDGTLDWINASPMQAVVDAENRLSNSIDDKLNSIDFDNFVDGYNETIINVYETTGSLGQSITNINNDINGINLNISEFNQRADGIEQTVSNLSGDLNELSGSVSTIDQKADNLLLAVGSLEGEVENTQINILSYINLSQEGVRIGGDKVAITGQTFIEEGVIGSAAIAHLAVDRFHLMYGIIDNVHIADATIEHSKMKSVDADKITVGNLRGIDIYGAKFRSSSGMDWMDITGGNIHLEQSNGRHVNVNPDGLFGYNASGSIRFQANSTLVTSAAFGTSTANVYLAAQSGFEARVVDMSGIPGSGNIGDYSYLPIRASGFYGNFWNINPAITAVNLYARPLSDGELRVTLNGTTDIYQPIRAESVKANVFEVNSLSGSSPHLYVKARTTGEVRTVVSGTIDDYIAVRSSGFYGSFLDRGTSSAGSHLYVRPAGDPGELRVTVRGTTDTYRPVRALSFYGNLIETNTGTRLYLRSAGEIRATKPGTTDSYTDFRAQNIYAQGELTQSSLAELKQDITPCGKSAIDIINASDVYQYKLKADVAEGIEKTRFGFIIGKGYRISEDFLSSNKRGIDIYSATIINTKAIQELDAKVVNVTADVENLKNENQSLKNRIKQLEEIVA